MLQRLPCQTESANVFIAAFPESDRVMFLLQPAIRGFSTVIRHSPNQIHK